MTWLFPVKDRRYVEIEVEQDGVNVLFDDEGGYGEDRTFNADQIRRLIMSLITAAREAGLDADFPPTFPDIMVLERRMEWKGMDLWLEDTVVGSVYPGKHNHWRGCTVHGGVIDEIAFTEVQAKNQVVWAMHQKSMNSAPHQP